MSHIRLIALALLFLPLPAEAQSANAGRPGPRIMLPREQEVALARSAAPAAVSGAATVLVLTERGFSTADTGTNGVTCMVSRSWPRSLEPVCYDAEASATIMPIEIRQNELLRAGRSQEEVDREIAEGLLNGKYRVPRRPAIGYMMSSGQVLYDDDGKRVGKWQPHLMIYYPYLTESDLGLGTTPSTQAAMVVDPGKPRAQIMVVVNQFVDPEPVGATGR
jgi:hypothetical protein